jgi:hypothetical protein
VEPGVLRVPILRKTLESSASTWYFCLGAGVSAWISMLSASQSTYPFQGTTTVLGKILAIGSAPTESTSASPASVSAPGRSCEAMPPAWLPPSRRRQGEVRRAHRARCDEPLLSRPKVEVHKKLSHVHKRRTKFMSTAIRPTPGSVQRDSQARVPRIPDPTPTGADIQPRSASREDEKKHKVAELAYILWQQRGCPEGVADEIWFEAERSVNRQ